MIAQETAGKIWNCYREIEEAKNLLNDEKVFPSDANETWRGLPVDRWTRDGFELAVPRDSHKRLYGIRPGLAKSVVKAHLAAMEAYLAELNEQARLELGGAE